MKPTKKLIRKAKLNARWKIFHGNKAYQQKIKVSEAYYKFWFGVMKHEPELFYEMERDRKARPARNLRAPPSPEESD